jgi:hypothetical protein
MGRKYLSGIDYKYLIFIFLFIIICLEIFGRIYLVHILKKSTKPKFQFDSYRIYSHKPNFREGDGEKDWIQINGQGFRRSTEVSKNKSTETYRIFLMGGSAAHGISTGPPYPLVHIYMDETIDYYLEQKLRSKYPDKNIEVINAAVTGYQVFQHTAYIVAEIIDYNPDLIIFVDGVNDHYMNNPEHHYMADNPYQFWKRRLQDPSIKGLMDYTFLWLSNFSGFARGFHSWRLNKDASSPSIFSNKGFANTLELISAHKVKSESGFLRAIETNIQILQSYGADIIICLQPMLVLRNFDMLSEHEKAFLHTDNNVKTLYPYVLEYLSSITNKYNVPFLDLNVAFNDSVNKGDQLLVDYCHFSPKGGEIVANEIFPVVDSLIKLKLPAFTFNY